MSKTYLKGRQLPNIVTTLRLVTIPLFVNFFLKGRDTAAFGILAFAYITDFLDGFLARRLKAETLAGRYFDDLTDLFLNASVVLALAYTGVYHWLTVFGLGACSVVLFLDVRIAGDGERHHWKILGGALIGANLAVLLFPFFAVNYLLGGLALVLTAVAVINMVRLKT